ncbi:unnamed protein product [Diatraea saccharalis]|uniref:Major facilitator superfamily (MFS) profile domain-containing protein n=1 Tax=Diatraea saccharalis TaxID=40085 RepID=A0A9N9QZE2_9NEOP|nr:unnamed protein product [Diatraea saccharalis]
MCNKKTEECKYQEKTDGQADEIKSFGWGIRHLQMACMTLTMVCLIIARASMGIAVLAMSDTDQKNNTSIEVYDWDKKTQSLILSSFFWGYVVMQIPSGVLAKRFGGKPILFMALLSNALVCLSVPTLAAWGGWILVCAARVTMGLTQACLFSSTQTLLGQWLPANERTNYTGIVYGGIQCGTIIAMPLSGYLAETSLGWKLIFYVTSGILLVNLAIWHFLGASCPRKHRWISEKEKQYIEAGLNVSASKLPTPWKHILRSKPVWAILAPQCGFLISFVFFFVDMPTYLEKGLGISLKNSALLAALPYIGMWFGNNFSSYLSEKIYNRGLLNLTACRKVFQSISLFGIAIALVVLSFLGPDQKLFAVATLIACLTMHGFSTAGFVVNQLDLSPNYAGVIMCILNFIANCGCSLTPIVTSVILRNDSTDISRWRIVFLIMAGLCAIANVIYLILGSSDRQPWDNPNYAEKKIADPGYCFIFFFCFYGCLFMSFFIFHRNIK